MNTSALFLALILTGINQPAYGNDLVVAEEDGSASVDNGEMPVAATDVEANELVTVEPPPTDAATAVLARVGEQAEFSRLFGETKQPSPTKHDEAIVAQAKASAWPWWSWPIGLLAIGVLLIIRSRVGKQEFPMEAIRVVSRQPLGKDGALALIELNDGDSRTRRLLVGLGGGSPRLVADVSAWEVAVAAPSNIMNDAVAVMGPDPDEEPVSITPQEAAAPNLRLATESFGSHLSQAAQRYGDVAAKVEVSSDRNDLIEDVLAKRERVRRETVDAKKSESKRSYSSREILA
jgi:hypothetical protein